MNEEHKDDESEDTLNDKQYTETLRINSSGLTEYYREGYWQLSWKISDEK